MHVQVISWGFWRIRTIQSCCDSVCGRSKATAGTMRNEIKIGVGLLNQCLKLPELSMGGGVQTVGPPLFPRFFLPFHPRKGKIIYDLRKLLGRNVACRSIIQCGCPLVGNIKRVGGVCQRRSAKIKHVFLPHRLRGKTRPDINNKFREFVSGTLVHLIIQHNVFYYLSALRLKTLSQIWWVFPFSLSVIRQVSELPGARNRLPKPLVRIEGTDAPMRRTFLTENR